MLSKTPGMARFTADIKKPRISEADSALLLSVILLVGCHDFPQILSHNSLWMLIALTVLISIRSASLPWVRIGLNSVQLESVTMYSVVGVVFRVPQPVTSSGIIKRSIFLLNIFRHLNVR